MPSKIVAYMNDIICNVPMSIYEFPNVSAIKVRAYCIRNMQCNLRVYRTIRQKYQYETFNIDIENVRQYLYTIKILLNRFDNVSEIQIYYGAHSIPCNTIRIQYLLHSINDYELEIDISPYTMDSILVADINSYGSSLYRAYVNMYTQSITFEPYATHIHEYKPHNFADMCGFTEIRDSAEKILRIIITVIDKLLVRQQNS